MRYVLTACSAAGSRVGCVVSAFQSASPNPACSPGSVPFLLKDHLSYSQLATFALSSYPYSLKLLWSPIVDSVYFVSVGRRKSWIIPMQLTVGTLMLYISFNVERLMDNVGTVSSPCHLVLTLSRQGCRLCLRINLHIHFPGFHLCHPRSVLSVCISPSQSFLLNFSSRYRR